MSNSQPSATEKGSGAVQCGSPSRPTSESLRGREILARGEEEEDSSGVETGDHGGGGSRAAGAEEEGSLREEVAESSGTRQEQSPTEAVERGDVDRNGGGDDDDGYHTPTSPRCRIPADLSCPPAPRKIPPTRRWRKRNLGDLEIYRVVRRRIQLTADLELLLLPVADGPPAGRVDNGAGGEDVVG